MNHLLRYKKSECPSIHPKNFGCNGVPFGLNNAPGIEPAGAKIQTQSATKKSAATLQRLNVIL